jgi:hypothetical protein
MTTAQRILNTNNADSFSGQQALESNIRALAVRCEGADCYGRVWFFYDGSSITKTRDGFKGE